MTKTKIEWADRVWNPVTGCTKVSEGCQHCYAERMAKRLAGRCGYPPEPDQFKVTLHPDKLEEPLHWKKPSRVFVDSMGDLFHKDVPNIFIDQIFWVMMMAPIHTFIVLTKKPKRMMEWINKDYQNPLPNVWLGVSVEDQKTADERIPWLLKTPAALRFVSVEPMLGPINLTHIDFKDNGKPKSNWDYQCHWKDCLYGAEFTGGQNGDIDIEIEKINWLICGCESGPGARPMELDWARSLRDQCQSAGVPFFLKQANIDGKLVKMPELDGKIWDEIPKNR